MNPQIQFDSLLRQHGFRLVSEHKHLKYGDREGRILVVSKTPSDWRAWHGMIGDLKRVVAAPPPSSAVLEEERQRKALEARIALECQRKPKSGSQGAVKTKGIGIEFRVKIVSFVSEEQREADRLNSEWDRLMSRIRNKQRRFESRLAEAYEFALDLATWHTVRRKIAGVIREKRHGEGYPQWRKAWVSDDPGAAAWRDKVFADGFKVFRVSVAVGDPVAAMCQYIFSAVGDEVQIADETADEKEAGFAERAVCLAVQLWWHAESAAPAWARASMPDGWSPKLGRSFRPLLRTMADRSPDGRKASLAKRLSQSLASKPWVDAHGNERTTE